MGFNPENALVDSSRLVADMVIGAVGNDPGRFAVLMKVVLEGKGNQSDRAARVAYLITDTRPEWIAPYAGRLISRVISTKRRSLRKNILRILTCYTFTGEEENLGVLIDRCFTWIIMEYENPALQVYAMDILEQMTGIEPGLVPELVSAIEEGMSRGSAGFRNRGTRVLKKIIRGKNPS